MTDGRTDLRTYRQTWVGARDACASKKKGLVVDADFVQVNETDFKSITHKDALAALRASDKVNERTKLFD